MFFFALLHSLYLITTYNLPGLPRNNTLYYISLGRPYFFLSLYLYIYNPRQGSTRQPSLAPEVRWPRLQPGESRASSFVTQAQTLGIEAGTITGGNNNNSVLRHQLPPQSPRTIAEEVEGGSSGSTYVIGQNYPSPSENSSGTRSQSSDSKSSTLTGSLEVAEGYRVARAKSNMNNGVETSGVGSQRGRETGSGGTWGEGSSSGSRSGCVEINLNLCLTGFPELAFLAQVCCNVCIGSGHLSAAYC